jgi:hypothetical protein
MFRGILVNIVRQPNTAQTAFSRLVSCDPGLSVFVYVLGKDFAGDESADKRQEIENDNHGPGGKVC